MLFASDRKPVLGGKSCQLYFLFSIFNYVPNDYTILTLTLEPTIIWKADECTYSSANHRPCITSPSCWNYSSRQIKTTVCYKYLFSDAARCTGHFSYEFIASWDIIRD
jgi:hypothetical protein